MAFSILAAIVVPLRLYERLICVSQGDLIAFGWCVEVLLLILLFIIRFSGSLDLRDCMVWVLLLFVLILQSVVQRRHHVWPAFIWLYRKRCHGCYPFFALRSSLVFEILNIFMSIFIFPLSTVSSIFLISLWTFLGKRIVTTSTC